MHDLILCISACIHLFLWRACSWPLWAQPCCRLSGCLPSFTDEISPLHCPDFQHEVAMCKIFTYCRRVNKYPSPACWDQSKSFGMDMKAWNSMWQGWVGCLCLCLRDWMTEQKIITHARVSVRVPNLLCTSCEPPAAPCGLQTPQASAAAPVKMGKTSLFQIELLLWNHQHGNMPCVQVPALA